MTGASLVLSVLGGAVVAAGLALLVNTLVGVRRRTRGANLEYGYPPGVVVAGGLALVDWGVGWSGAPLTLFIAAALVLTVLFAVVIVWVGRGN